MPPDPAARFAGCLIGGALGDSLLLPAEGLARERIARRFPGPLRQRLLLGRGMVSDDTDHHFLTARCLAAQRRDPQAFARRLGWRLRWWLACLPAGCGKATALGILRLWLGWPPARAGVASGGNGPSMRAAIIGAVHAQDRPLRRAFVAASTALTHRHPHAEAAALALAETAAWIVRGGDEELWPLLEADDPGWQDRLATLRAWHLSGAGTDALAASLGCPQRVSAWSLHSVPFALGCWLRHRDDPAAGFASALRAGGDTDSVGAFLGSLYGTERGEAAFPAEWIARLTDWPVSVAQLRAAGAALAGAAPWRWAWFCLLPRNAGFMAVILAHGLRRMLP